MNPGNSSVVALRPTAIEHSSHEDTALIVVDGQLDVGAAVGLRSRLRDAVKAQPQSLVIDLALVDEMDGAGLAVVISALRRTRRQGICAWAVPPLAASATRILDLTGLAPAFDKAG